MVFGESFGNEQYAAYSSSRGEYGHGKQEELFDVFPKIGIKEVGREVVGTDPGCDWAFARATEDEDLAKGIDAHLWVKEKGWLRVDVTTDTSKARETEKLAIHPELDAVIAISGRTIDLAARGGRNDRKAIIRAITEVVNSI